MSQLLRKPTCQVALIFLGEQGYIVQEREQGYEQIPGDNSGETEEVQNVLYKLILPSEQLLLKGCHKSRIIDFNFYGSEQLLCALCQVGP